MVNSAFRPDESLPDALAARARAVSDGRLAIDVALGLITAAGAALWRPTGWLVPFSAAVCFAAFGAWGIADRELSERARESSARLVRILTALQAVAVLVGSLAALVLIFSALGFVLGRMIS
jgi:hypothetical protein